jgi:hypothetical protein
MGGMGVAGLAVLGLGSLFIILCMTFFLVAGIATGSDEYRLALRSNWK